MELLAWTAILVYIAARDDGWAGRVALAFGVLHASGVAGAVLSGRYSGDGEISTLTRVLATGLLLSTLVSVFEWRDKR